MEASSVAPAEEGRGGHGCTQQEVVLAMPRVTLSHARAEEEAAESDGHVSHPLLHSQEKSTESLPGHGASSPFSLKASEWRQFFRTWKWDPAPFYGPYGMYLALSVAANGALALLFVLLLMTSWMASSREAHEPMLRGAENWAMPAVTSALAAFERECSGRGDVWTDGGSCECHMCFEGRQCEREVANCTVDVSRGDPLMFEAFWKENAASSSVLIPGHYRIGYANNGQESFWASQALENVIRKLHSKVGNAVVEGKHVVVGVGSMQLINAVLLAFGHLHSGSSKGVPLVVTSEAPYYQAYGESASYLDSRLFSWGGKSSGWLVRQAPKRLEFVTSPNNPDGRMQDAPALTGQNVVAVYDHAYYWPHFAPIARAADHDVMLFTLSKLTGHAGTRIGWALVKDAALANAMNAAIASMTLGVPHESQLRAVQVLNSLLMNIHGNRDFPPKAPLPEGEGPEKFAEQGLLFSYGASLMLNRWLRLRTIMGQREDLPGTPRFSLQAVEEPQYCKFFTTTRAATPAYAWVKCNYLNDADCFEVFKGFGVEGRPGPVYGAGREFVRFSLLMRDSTFDLLVKRLTTTHD